MSNRIVFKIRPMLDMPGNPDYLNSELVKARAFLLSREIHEVKSLIVAESNMVHKVVTQQTWE